MQVGSTCCTRQSRYSPFLVDLEMDEQPTNDPINKFIRGLERHAVIDWLTWLLIAPIPPPVLWSVIAVWALVVGYFLVLIATS